MKILAIGDIFGKPGRRAIEELLPKIMERENIDFVIANAENASGGRGLTPKVLKELFKFPINVVTSGNHIWEFDSLHPFFDSDSILRPVNMSERRPGRGWMVFDCKGLRIGVVSLQGQVFMENKGPGAIDPFQSIEGLLPTLRSKADIIIVDFHAEATSEKRAMAWFLDGRVSAVLGTHTHIQTADEEILPLGAAYITDLGMTGPHESVIGLRKEEALKRFLNKTNRGFKVAKGGVRLEGVILVIDEPARKVTEIRRIKERLL